jgi:plastocyanin domain-containing protein
MKLFATSLGLTLALLVGACSAEAEAPVSNKVEMVVTEAGFVPQNFSVKKGEPVTLIITRKTNDTCANEIVIDEHGINVKLPLNQPVTVTFTPKRSGTLKYGCAMQKMLGGVITIKD